MKIILVKEVGKGSTRVYRWIYFKNKVEHDYRYKVMKEDRKCFDHLYMMVKGKTPKQEALLYIHHDSNKFKQIALAILKGEDITAHRNKLTW